MKKIIIALAATTAIAAAAPAAAQFGGQFGTNIELRTDQLQSQLQAGIQAGTITRVEAAPLRDQLRQLSQLERQYSRNGFTVQERTELRSRAQTLRQQIRFAIRNGDDRYGRDDRYGDRYDRDCPPGLEKKNNGCLPPGQVGRDDRNGRWGDDNRDRRTTEWMDRNRDGFDDRDLNRDRRIDEREWRMADGRYDDRYDRDDRDGRYDRDDRYGDDRYGDGRYENNQPRRGGIGGIIENVLGGGGLRVGQRVSGNLGSVPYEYRNQFRDGNGVYYRADSRNIYQIDARTDTVVRIYTLNR
jgi:hypothetical protein